ncbi:MAG: hypothetical protein WC840_04505 [Candidatus Peribacteraceae bacterium]
MTSMSRQLRAVEFAAISTFLTAALIGLPLLAATNSSDSTGPGNQYYAEYIVSRFQRLGAPGGIYDNLTINSSAFDLVQYMSDVCYRPNDNSLPACKQEFGPYYNLKDTMDNGTLASILDRYPYFAGVEKLFPASSQPGKEAQKLSPDAELQLEIDQRSRQVWDICQKMYSDRNDQSRCFQRNIRLVVQRTDLDVEEGNIL